MQFAVVDGISIEPAPGIRGNCRFCQAEMIAKCGRHKIWHWAHKSRMHCDPWWEPETEWHREWKNCFPSEWHEIIQVDPVTGEKHIADVKTSHSLVIEFQHSTISPVELKSREEFYNNMVWIVDGCKNEQNRYYFDLGEPASEPSRRSHTATTSSTSGQSTLFDLIDEASTELVSASPVSEEPSVPFPEFRTDYRFYWYSSSKFFHNWAQATKPVYVDFGDDTLWHLKDFTPSIKQGIVRRVYKTDLIDRFI